MKKIIYKQLERLDGLPMWWTRRNIGADAKSFEVLDNYYAKDKNKAYYKGVAFDAHL